MEILVPRQEFAHSIIISYKFHKNDSQSDTRGGILGLSMNCQSR
jgi:hypothetical protein